jgi:hypothetical protein
VIESSAASSLGHGISFPAHFPKAEKWMRSPSK